MLTLCHCHFQAQLLLAVCRRWHTEENLPEDLNFQTPAQSSPVMKKFVISTWKGATGSRDESKYPGEPNKCPK